MHQACRSAALLTLTFLGVAACGGDDPIQGPTEPGEPSGESPTLDYGPVLGSWAGWAAEGDIQFWVRANFTRSDPRPGNTVGTVEYGLLNPDSEPECGGNWIASHAADPVFTVVERITFGSGCPDGTGRLELDTTTGVLTYEFTPDSGEAFARGTLTRGDDPGPRP